METNKKDTKPIKNYIISFALVIVAILSCIYFIKSYEIHKENDLSISILEDYLNSIKINELNDYLIENPDISIYTCFSDSEQCRKLELKLRKTIVENNLREQLLYLNLKPIKAQYSNYKEKINEIIPNMDVNETPKILIYNSGNLIEIKQVNTTDEVLEILNKYGENYIND